MNPDKNKFEELKEEMDKTVLESINEFTVRLIRPDGSFVPDHWSIFQVGEKVVIKNYTFEIAHIGESHLLLEPIGPVIIDKG